jgi:hypothetical protein
MMHIAAGTSTPTVLNERTATVGDLGDIPAVTPVILVNGASKDDQVIDGIAYIEARARELDANCIINLSYSHDGPPEHHTDLLSRAISDMLDNRCLLVVSAGNRGDRSYYTHVSNLRDATATITMSTKARSAYGVELEGSFAGDNATFIITGPDGKSTGPIAVNTIRGARISGAHVLVDTRLAAENSKRGISILITSADETTAMSGNVVWKIGVSVPTAKQGEGLDLWIRDLYGADATLQPRSANATAVSMLAGMEHTLSVGAYRVDNVTQVLAPAPYSSISQQEGQQRIPDVWAPGDIGYFCEQVHSKFNSTGTSPAAALTTRIAAELWRRHPELDSTAISSLLRGKVLLGAGRGPTLSFPRGYAPARIQDLLRK